jgi:hypothetical protein
MTILLGGKWSTEVQAVVAIAGGWLTWYIWRFLLLPLVNRDERRMAHLVYLEIPPLAIGES